jgi:uncharacterized surface protein with fasciclin (FAS1) repeats
MTQLWLGGRTLGWAGHGSPSRPVRGRPGAEDFTRSQSAVVPAHSIEAMECCGMTQLWLGGRTLGWAGHGSPSRPVRGRWGAADFTRSQSAVVPAHSMSAIRPSILPGPHPHISTGIDSIRKESKIDESKIESSSNSHHVAANGSNLNQPSHATMKKLFRSAIALFAMTSFAVGADKKDIVDTAVGAGSFKTLVAAVTAAGLVDTLKGEGPFTVFAPTDEAFAKLPAGTVEDLLKPENKAKLVDILTYHVVSGKVMSTAAVKLDKATAVNKKDIKLSVKDGSLMLNESAKVATADIEASNGVIHVIDTVILPPAK